MCPLNGSMSSHAHCPFGLLLSSHDRRFSWFCSPLVEVNGLYDIAREEQFDDPVHRDPHFALQAGELGEVDSTPQEPGEEAREAESLNLRTGSVVADDAERAQRVKMEWLE